MGDDARAHPDVLAATVASAAMIAQQVAGKATRDALFLTQFDVRQLPGMMMLGSVVSLGTAWLSARALARYGPLRVVRAAFLLGALAFALEFVASWASKRTLAVVVYLHMALFGATLISLFWSLINERFDPHAAKPAVARIAAGGTLGGVLGGFIGLNIASLTSVRAMLVALAVFNAVALAAVERFGAARSATPLPGEASTARGGRYLWMLGALIALVAAIEAVTDFMFAAGVRERVADGRRLMAFFSAFHMVVSVLTFLAQAGLSRRVLQRFGVFATIGALPLVVLVLAGAVARAPSIFTVVLLRAGENVVSHSLFRSGYELLYTPVARERKRPAKTLIDVGCDRLGTLIGGAIVLAILGLALPREALPAAVMTLALIALIVGAHLRRGYVEALEQGLRSSRLEGRASGRPDADTRAALLRGLSDREFEVRYECALALARLVEREASAAVPHDRIFEVLRRELEDEPLDERTSRRLEHVATLLSLLFERGPMRVAFRALNGADDALRGTAIEYLENVLPPELRAALHPYLARPARRSRARTRASLR